MPPTTIALIIGLVLGVCIATLIWGLIDLAAADERNKERLDYLKERFPR
jgi:uncharacterized membrane-anchored protein YhcB (DUF1043 family)